MIIQKRKPPTDLFSATSSFINQRNKAYKSGAALKGHVRSAHQGIFTESCQACKELKRKSA